MCHPAVIVLSAQVSFLPSQEIKGVTVWFQLGSSLQSSLCPFPTMAGGVQLCICREGRVPCLGWMHRQQLGSTWAKPERGQLCQPGWAEPSPGSAAPAGVFTVVFSLLSSPSQLLGLSCESSPGENSPCFIWEIIKMKRGDFTACSVVDLEKTEMTAAVLC